MTKVFVPFMLQIPAWILMSLSLRRLVSNNPEIARYSDEIVRKLDIFLQTAKTITSTVSVLPQVRYVQFLNEGTLWFPNLIMPDTTAILPVVLGVSYLANTELNSNRHDKSIIPTTRAKVRNDMDDPFPALLTFFAFFRLCRIACGESQFS